MNPETVSTTSVVDPAPVYPEPPLRRVVPAAKASHHTSAPKDNASRCLHRYGNGRRCGLPGPKSGFCLRHFESRIAANMRRFSTPTDFEDLSADLLPQPSEFDAALSVNQFLSRLLVLVTKGRVTPRRAAVMAYITNQLLHSQRAIERELNVEEEICVIPGDMPRPNRDWPGQERQHSGPTVIWDVTDDDDDLPCPDRSQPDTSVVQPFQIQS